MNKQNYSRFYLFALLVSLLLLVFYVIVQQRRDDDAFESAVLSDYAGYVARVLTDQVKNRSPGAGEFLVLRDVTIEVPSSDLKNVTLPHDFPIVTNDQLEDVRRHLGGKPGNYVVQDTSGVSRYVAISGSSQPRGGLLVRITPKTSLFRMSRLLVPFLFPFIVVMIFWSVMAIWTQQKNLIASNRANLNLSAELRKATQNAEDCLHGPVQASYALIIRKIDGLSVEFRDCLKEVKDYINEVSFPIRGYMRYFREIGEDVPVISMFAYYLHCVELLVGARCKITSFLPTEEYAERVLRGNTEAKIALQMNLYDAVQNAITHSEAKNIEVRMEISDSATTLIVEDDGKGFDLEKNLDSLESQNGRGHYGLEHFLRRARYFDKDVKNSQVIQTSPGKGCRISLRISQKPIENQKLSFRRLFALLQDYVRNFCTAHISGPKNLK